ncbi:MAG: hypothetical protein U0527_15760 [Candidatus Eisenbacteria bacterium]
MSGCVDGVSRSNGFARGLTVAALAGMLALSPLPRLGATSARADGGLVTILKDGLYGGATGLLLGAVIALVVDSDHRDDSVRWGIVLGTFGGCAYGIYDVSQDGFSALPTQTTEPVAVRLEPLVPTTAKERPVVGATAPLALRAELERAGQALLIPSRSVR